jgi:hypothetical protein
MGWRDLDEATRASYSKLLPLIYFLSMEGTKQRLTPGGNIIAFFILILDRSE